MAPKNTRNLDPKTRDPTLLGPGDNKSFECPDYLNDVRSARRLKRWHAANQNFEFNSCGNATTKNVNRVAMQQRKISCLPFSENYNVCGTSYPLECPAKDGTAYTEIHNDYTKFLSNVRMDGQSMIYRSISGEVIRYEGDEECVDDYGDELDIVLADDDPQCKPLSENYNVCGKSYALEWPAKDSTTYDYAKFLSNVRMYGQSMIYTSISGEVMRYEGDKECSSELKEKLMTLLQKPYDQKEYDDLWKKASYQRKRKRQPHTMTCGRKHKSYFDQNPDLKKKIDSVKRDRRKVLNLLRGFFYWLQHVPDAESFMPWLDPSCLEVLPGEVDE